MSKAGYVSIIGKPNAGKSTIANYLLNEKLSLVSHKQNATRKRSLSIVHYLDSQIIFVDTPGIHQKEKLLNQFMLQEALRALGECDLCLFLSPVNDDTYNYEKFLKLSNKPHIILLTKADLYSNEQVLKSLIRFQKFSDKFIAIIPTTNKREKSKEAILKEIYKKLETHPFYFDPDLFTTKPSKDIYADFIQEAIFEKLSDEIPYESDVEINLFKDEKILKINATIILEKESQKILLIGKGGEGIKRIGTYARKRIEAFAGKKMYLELFVSVKKGWSKNQETLKEQGYYYN